MMSDSLLSTDNLIGRILLGRYRVVRELAKGGMGVVYLARAEGAVGFVKPVVIKLVLPEHTENERFIGMFVREARILSQLRHPSIVEVLEFGEENGAYVMVLEYVRGFHMGQWSKYLKRMERQVPADLLLLLMIDVLEALHKAHTMVHPDGTPMQIVHRDVSPSNILLDEDGRARLLDFGVARMRGNAHDYQTQVKSFVGKLTYSAPEMFSGHDATPQSDLYSCAVVLHEMLIGRNVFSGKNQAATLNLVLNHVPEPLEGLRSDAPAGLDAVLGKALAKSAAERHGSAEELAQELRALLTENESVLRARIATTLKEDFGETMAAILGVESLAARDEAWRRLSVPPSSGFDDSYGITSVRFEPEPSSHTAVRRGPRSSGRIPVPVAPPPPPLPGERSGTGPLPMLAPPQVPPPPPSGATSTATGPILVAPQAARAHTLPAVWIGLGIVSSLAVLAIVLQLRSAPAAAPLPTPAIRVVNEPANPLAAVARPEQESEAEPSDTEQAAASNTGKTGKASKSAKPSGPDPASLTRAFRRQQGKVEACFKQHAANSEGLPRIQLAFDLAATGKIASVRVLPATVASSALGTCLQSVGEGTRFPAQGEPVSFDIPITASRTGG